jgi:hypothetical protein
MAGKRRSDHPNRQAAPIPAVADLLAVIRARLLRCLIRRRTVEDDGVGQTPFLADDLAEREPALAQLAVAAVPGLPRIRRSNLPMLAID